MCYYERQTRLDRSEVNLNQDKKDFKYSAILIVGAVLYFVFRFLKVSQ